DRKYLRTQFQRISAPPKLHGGAQFEINVKPLRLLIALVFCFQWYGDHLNLHSFPTRRSSDLPLPTPTRGCGRRRSFARPTRRSRSEEHTSELQSRGHLVCRRLLEKKNYDAADAPFGIERSVVVEDEDRVRPRR